MTIFFNIFKKIKMYDTVLSTKILSQVFFKKKIVKFDTELPNDFRD